MYHSTPRWFDCVIKVHKNSLLIFCKEWIPMIVANEMWNYIFLNNLNVYNSKNVAKDRNLQKVRKLLKIIFDGLEKVCDESDNWAGWVKIEMFFYDIFAKIEKIHIDFFHYFLSISK